LTDIPKQHNCPVAKLFRQRLSDDALIFLSTRKNTEDIPYHIVTLMLKMKKCLQDDATNDVRYRDGRPTSGLPASR